MNLKSAVLLSLAFISLSQHAHGAVRTCDKAFSSRSRAKSQTLKAGDTVTSLDRSGFEIGKFGTTNYFFNIDDRSDARMPHVFNEYQSSATTATTYPPIPVQTAPNCLAMTLAYAAQVMKGANFDSVLASAWSLAGNNPFRSAWQFNPFLANSVFGPMLSQMSLDNQISDLKSKLPLVGFQLVAEQTALDFDDVKARLDAGQKMIFGGNVVIDSGRTYLLNAPKFEGEKFAEGRWVPDNNPPPRVLPSNSSRVVGGHAMLLVEAIQNNLGSFLVFADTSTGEPLITNIETVNRGLVKGFWIQ